jgi:hypothetical protein
MLRTLYLLFCTAIFYLTNLSAQGLIIDHLAVAEFDQIPGAYITRAKAMFNLNFCNSSHGEQIIIGMTRLKAQNSNLDFQVRDCSVIENPAIFSISKGLGASGSCDNYIEHQEYWDSDAGKLNVRNTLQANPLLNLSTWTWCYQQRVSIDPVSYIPRYLNAMPILESQSPNVIFIYMTGHSGTYYGHHTYSPTDASYDVCGYFAYVNNEQIRTFCRNNNKVLFDFGDIDYYWFNPNTQAWECGDDIVNYSGAYNGRAFKREHSHYNLNQDGHTSFENCENKAKAFWVLLAKLAGWNNPGGDTTPPDKVTNLQIIK